MSLQLNSYIDVFTCVRKPSVTDNLQLYFDFFDEFVFKDNEWRWVTAQILEKVENRLKIKPYGMSNFDWINDYASSTQIAPLNTHTKPFQIINADIEIPESDRLLYKFRKVFFVHHSKEIKYIIAITKNYAIFKYNVINNKWTQINDEAPTNKIDSSCNLIITLNSKTNKLYLINYIVGIWEFNLMEPYSWNVLLNKIPFIGARNTANIWIDDNILRIIDWVSMNKILDINITTKTCNITDNTELFGFIYSVKVENNSNLLLKYSDNKWEIGALHGLFGEKTKWICKTRIIPYYAGLKDITQQMFDNNILMFARCYIWLYDVNNDKWFQCIYEQEPYWMRVLKQNGYYDCIDTKDNFIHFIIKPLKSAKLLHFKIHILDIIPKKMNEYYTKLNNILIFGYVAELERNNNNLCYNMPIYLKQLILSYYPNLLYID